MLAYDLKLILHNKYRSTVFHFPHKQIYVLTFFDKIRLFAGLSGFAHKNMEGILGIGICDIKTS